MITDRCPAPDWWADDENDPKAARDEAVVTPHDGIPSSAATDEMPETERSPSGQSALVELGPAPNRARWVLVASFEEDGRRYVVARENQPGLDSLTQRERQVVSQAARGFTNKQIPYELGIAGTRVRVSRRER